ncbi:hypothetical protein E2C01_065749 [Portunus trituberculatus]|uniref:Uncharacterized protein n=1 Tax=Portunus trituberculatus TaxID=210409 RepID=A0A5B7HFE9_PORTR|nr:hypothetical protein [Portunus trituberculatus]
MQLYQSWQLAFSSHNFGAFLSVSSLLYDLVEQEHVAAHERVLHEPALSFTRRLLRDGKPVPRTLPTARPLGCSPPYRDYTGEGEWVDYATQDHSDMEDERDPVDVEGLDEDALLLDENQDLN